MTSIDQLLQSFGTSSAQTAGALLGTETTEGVETTGEFAAALKVSTANISNNKDDITPPSAITEAGELYAVTSTDGVSSVADILADYQATIDPTQADTQPDGNTNTAIQQLLQNPNAKEVIEGIPGLQLSRITNEQLVNIVENVSLDAGATTKSTDSNISDTYVLIADPAVTSGQTQNLHFLSFSELEALTNALPSTPSGGNSPVVSDQVQTTSQNTSPQNTSISIATSATPTSDQTTLDATALDKNTKPAIAQNTEASAAPNQSVSSTSAQSLDTDLTDDIALAKVAEKITANAQKAEQTVVRADEKAAEGYGVQSNQAQQAAGAAAQAASKQNTNTVTNQASNNKTNLSSQNNPIASNNQSSSNIKPDTADTPDLGSAKPIEVPQAKTAPQATPQSTQAPNQPPLTPERIAGYNSTASAETVAGGLSGLRGEASFSSSFGLLGGKPSPALGAHVAKQVNLQVTRAVNSGQNEFTIRLDPAELGRVQVKMNFVNGQITTKVIAERPETLELMQREVRGLERAMETAGHKASQDGISFSLDTGDGQSAGKSFAEAVQKDRLDDQIKNGASPDGDASVDESGNYLPDEDLATLEEILARVTPETGLDVRI